MSPASRAPWLLAALVLSAGVLGVRTLRTRATHHFTATQTYEDVYYLPPAPWLPVLSLGYDEAFADLIWMRGLIYFGAELVHRGDADNVARYGDAALALDPDFRAIYHWVAVGTLYHHGDLPVEDIEKAVAFLERGMRRFPDDGQMAWDLGATMAYELAPRLDDPDRKDDVRRRATEWMMMAARTGHGPPWLALTNATQLERLGRTEQAARHVEEMYAVVQDPELRQQLQWRIAALRSEAHAEAMRRTVEELEARRQAEYPYLSPTLYLLVGPRLDARTPAPPGGPPEDDRAGEDPADGSTDPDGG